MESPLFKSIIDINESNIIEDTKTKNATQSILYIVINIIITHRFFPNPFKSNKNERILIK